MVAGDVVNGFGPLSSSLTLQPAAGVEVMITHGMTGTTGVPWISLYNATVGTAAYGFQTGSVTQVAYGSRFAGYKFFINNTNYLHIFAPAVGEHVSYTGIQIK